MKQSDRPPPKQGRSGVNKPVRTAADRSHSVGEFACDFKKTLAPKSLDISFLLRYRR